MSKGIASRNSLKALAHPIHQFLSGWGAREKPGTPRLDPKAEAQLPAPYELASLRGEGILRARFFGQFTRVRHQTAIFRGFPSPVHCKSTT